MVQHDQNPKEGTEAVDSGVDDVLKAILLRADPRHVTNRATRQPNLCPIKTTPTCNAQVQTSRTSETGREITSSVPSLSLTLTLGLFELQADRTRRHGHE